MSNEVYIYNCHGFENLPNNAGWTVSLLSKINDTTKGTLQRYETSIHD